MLAPEFGGDNAKRVDPDPYDKPVVAFPGALGADSDGDLHRHAVPGEVSRRRVRRVPRIVEPRAALAGAATTWRSCRSTTRACRSAPTRPSPTGLPARTEFVNPGDARFRPAGVAVGPGRLALRHRHGEGPHLARHLHRRDAPRTPRGAPRRRAGDRRRRRSTDRAARSSISRSAPPVTCPTARGVPGMQPSLADQRGRRRRPGDADQARCCRARRRCCRPIARSTPCRCRRLPRR